MWDFKFTFQITIAIYLITCMELKVANISDLSNFQMPVLGSAVCSFTYSKKDKINALSLAYEKEGYAKCEYVIKAPRNNYIVLNLTDLIGFRWYPGQGGGGSTTTDLNSLSSDYSFTESSDNKHLKNNNCLPPELIIQETLSGKEATKNRICNSQNYKIPHVFQSKSNLLKIIYIWVREEHSGFSLDFDFHQKNNNCAFKCDDSKCLSSTLVCNEEYNCVDKTDEINCSQNQNKGASTHVIKIVVIVVSVVLMPVLAALVCVASPCRLTSRMWRRWRSRERGSVEHRQLRPQSQDSEVVYVPTSSTSATQDLMEQKQIQQIKERNLLSRSAQTTFRLGVPPQIQISRDGEEGYAASQKQLLCHRKNNNNGYQEYHTAPPNKTVHDKDSPPPYYSRSASSVDSLGHSGMSSRRVVSDCNGYSVMLQCCNMSNSNHHHNHSSLQVHESSRTKTVLSSSPPLMVAGARHSRNIKKSSKNCLDQPPDYSSVISASTDVYNQSSSDDGV